MVAPNKIDSNITGLAFAEEASLKVLPGVVTNGVSDESTAVWRNLEPNGYSDFGAEIATVARSFINPSRQKRKGGVSDLDASGGFTQDLTHSNLAQLLQGFFFADAHQRGSSDPLTGTRRTLDVDATSINISPGITMQGNIHASSGFAEPSNNFMHADASAPGAVLTACTPGGALTPETTPPDSARVDCVGHQFGAGDLTVTVVNGVVTLDSAVDFTTLGIQTGEWLFVGGDDAATRFATAGTFYGRVGLMTADKLTMEECTGTPATDTGAGKTIQVFFGTFIRNENNPSLIKRRSFQFERQLGNDGDGVQAEYIKGAVANELSITIPTADKIEAELNFVALDTDYRDGIEGLKDGDRIAAPGEDAFNTSTGVFRQRLAIHGSATPLFAYVTEAKLDIKNGVAANKAVGVLGGFDLTAGDFEVSGEITAYFSTVAAVAAVRRNDDVSFNVIGARENSGFVFDIPLLSLSGSGPKVEKDKEITLPVNLAAAENKRGYTASVTFFPYLPNIAMPQ